MNKKTTKPESQVAPANCGSIEANEAGLKKLNELYAKYCKAHDTLVAEYNKALAEMNDVLLGKRKAARLASAQFNLMRKRLPPTKFDMTSGSYFFAEEDGIEVFAVKLSRSESCTIHVAAKDEEAARSKAIDVIKADESLLKDMGLSAEIVSCK